MRVQPEQSSHPADRHAWTSEARTFVQNKQEDAYRALAAALGLGLDPKKAYEKLSPSPGPLGDGRPGDFIEEARRAGIPLREKDVAAIKAGLTGMYRHYFSLEPPTLYELQDRYASMVLTFDGLNQTLVTQGHSLDPPPLLASLPSGDINARILFAPGTRTPILFFEQALFRFFSDFSRVAGWAFQPISPLQMYDEAAIRRLPTRYTMPFTASEYFVSALYAYVVDGSTARISSELEPPPHNLFLSMELLQAMEWFVMGHELAHLILGHLDKPIENRTVGGKLENWQREYDADLFSLDLMIALSAQRGQGWVFNFWACDLALTLFTCLYRGISFLEFGTFDTAWTSRTHPDPASRRACLRGEVLRTKFSWKDTIRSKLRLGTAAGTLCSMTDALLLRLFEMSLLAFAGARNHNISPSPIWRDLIASSFRPLRGSPT